MLDRIAPRPLASRWELEAESIAVSIRWFGLVVGVLLANFGEAAKPWPLNTMLLLGLGFTALDTFFSIRGRVFLRDFPLAIAAMEATFIGMLCGFHIGLESPFRFYYLLSLICCAIRYSPATTFAACGLDCFSLTVIFLIEPAERRSWTLYLLTLVIVVWITYAAGALARLLKRSGLEREALNAQLLDNQRLLESRIAERTRELEESQARVLHQEKMAAFGLLAAGIAHEVGNPLMGISNIVQLLDRQEHGPYTREKLALVTGQLARIQGILRELTAFGRPASTERSRVSLRDAVGEALSLAKYYKGGQARSIVAELPDDLPSLHGVRDQFVQVVFNLVVNAIDATGKGGTIRVEAERCGSDVVLRVVDDGSGIAPESMPSLFRPYFTTKKHGTGLGLFVLKRIVEAHAGTVEVASTPGRGTAFSIRFPTATPSEPRHA